MSRERVTAKTATISDPGNLDTSRELQRSRVYILTDVALDQIERLPRQGKYQQAVASTSASLRRSLYYPLSDLRHLALKHLRIQAINAMAGSEDAESDHSHEVSSSSQTTSQDAHSVGRARRLLVCAHAHDKNWAYTDE